MILDTAAVSNADAKRLSRKLSSIQIETGDVPRVRCGFSLAIVTTYVSLETCSLYATHPPLFRSKQKLTTVRRLSSQDEYAETCRSKTMVTATATNACVVVVVQKLRRDRAPHGDQLATLLGFSLFLVRVTSTLGNRRSDDAEET